MRHFRKSLFLGAALLASLVFPGARVSQAVPTSAGVPGGPFASAFRIQNLGSTAADCSYTVYNDNGSPVFSKRLPSKINSNDSAYIHTPSVPDFPAGTFAGVVQCDQPVAAVVNFSDANKGDSYVGTSSPASTLYVPSAYRNYYSYYSSFRIQNTTAQARQVTISYYEAGKSQPVTQQTINLAANGAATVDQVNVSQLAPNKTYSARISSNGALAATVSIYGGERTSVAKQLYSYSAFSGGSTSPIFAPVIMRNYYGYNTATTIQNVGSTTANVKLTYSNGTVKEFSIPSNAAQVIADFNEPTLQRNVLYGSKIESTNGQPLIVTVNESILKTSRATTYEGVASGGRTVVAPIVMKRYYGYNSSITCQNVGDKATNIRVTYSQTGISNKLVVSNLAPGKTSIIYQPGETALSNGYLGSATIAADNSNIACVVNQDKNEGTAAKQVTDQLYAYVAIVKP